MDVIVDESVSACPKCGCLVWTSFIQEHVEFHARLDRIEQRADPTAWRRLRLPKGVTE